MGLPWHRRYRRTLLSQAVWAVQAGQLLPSGRGLVDLSGNGNHAYFGGNASTPTTNDPTVLPWRGQKEVWFPGTNGNYLSTTKYIPSGGVFRIEAEVDGLDYGGAQQQLVGVYLTTGNQRSWGFYPVTTGGLPSLQISDNGDSTPTVISADSAFPAGTRFLAVEVNLDDGWCDFYVGNGQSWAQHGGRKTFTPHSLFNANANLVIGGTSNATTSVLTGRVASLRLYQDGVQVRGFNAANCAEPYATVADEVSGTWTLNRSSSGLKLAVVDRDMLALGTDDFLQVANHPLLNFGAGQDFTVAAAVRTYGTTVGYLIAKWSASGTGWGLLKRTDLYSLRSSIPTPTSADNDTPDGAFSDGVAFVGVSRRAANRITTMVVNSVTSEPNTVSASLANSQTLRIGARGGGYYLDGEIFGVAIFREALTDDDLSRLARELGVAA